MPFKIRFRPSSDPHIALFLSISLGYAIAHFLGVSISDVALGNLDLLLYALLSVGLYGSVYSLRTDSILQNRSTIIAAITVGIFFKFILVGVAFFTITGDLRSFVYAIILTPIDPLTVAALLARERNMFSDRAKSILRAWSSFDDPLVAVIALYAVLPWVLSTISPQGGGDSGIGSYVYGVTSNLALAGLFYVAHTLLRSTNSYKYTQYVLLCSLFILAIPLKLTLGVAIVGMFLRPPFRNRLSSAVISAYLLSGVIIGSYLVSGADVTSGLMLSALSIVAEITVMIIIGHGLSKTDRIFLSFAVQKGISAVILAIVFELYFEGTVAVVAPAIVILNVFYFLFNRYIVPLLQDALETR